MSERFTISKLYLRVPGGEVDQAAMFKRLVEGGVDAKTAGGAKDAMREMYAVLKTTPSGELAASEAWGVPITRSTTRAP